MLFVSKTKTTYTVERIQSGHLGRRLPLAGANYQTPAAPFHEGCS